MATNLARPVFVCSPPGDSNRLFIVEQRNAQNVGRIRIFDRATGSLLATPFLTTLPVRNDSEEGLLGLAFDPGYETNGFFYLNLNPLVGARRTEIQRYRVQGDPITSNVADPNSREMILSYDQPFSNHNGGWLGFGPDGYLYIASGDGGSGDDPQNNAQTRTNLLGKILRIDVRVPEGNTNKYLIPDGNPFKDSPPRRGEIWAFGLRNPWRCSFDRETGHLWIGDVGQSAREEIDVNPAGVGGLNFGWRPREGFIQNPNRLGENPVTPRTDPIFDYDNNSLGVSVTGGYVYRGTAVPELRGKYIFADYGSARFWTTTLNDSQTNGTTTQITTDINPGQAAVRSISSFGEDAEGELYICELHATNGKIFRILAEGPTAAIIRSAELSGSEIVMSFDALATQSYVVEGTGLLGQGTSWDQVSSISAATTNRTVTVTNAVTGDARYFRIRSE
ncbi:MAG TPA: PQQ-dependent sugar dehydrogenase [Verrucomicrobiae bacterium]